MLRRSKHGDKLVRAAPGRWSERTEEIFFAELGRTGCVKAAAKAAGISTNALYYRREKYPEFAARWAEVEAKAGQRISGLLTAATIASLDPEEAGRGKRRGRGALPKVNVDQAIRIAALKGRESGGEARRRGGIRPRVATNAEVREALEKSLVEFGKRVRARCREGGWSETEEGHLIPPGWIYVGTGDENEDSRRHRPRQE